MRENESYWKEREYHVRMEMLRQKVIDYYGSASHMFPVAMADVDRVSQMDEDELIEEAIRLGII